MQTEQIKDNKKEKNLKKMATEQLGTIKQYARPKFAKGKKIETLPEAISRIVERKPFYWRHKFMASGFIERWPVVEIAKSIQQGVLWSADKISGSGQIKK